MPFAQLGRGADPLVSARRWHPDVGQHHVRVATLDGGQQLGQVDAQFDDLDIVVGAEEFHDALAHEQGVLGHDEPDHHRCRTLVRDGSCGPRGVPCLLAGRRGFLTFVLTRLLCGSGSVFTGQADARRVPNVKFLERTSIMNEDMNLDSTSTDKDLDPSGSSKSLRKGLTIGLAAGLLGGAAAGFAFGVPGLTSAASPSAVQQTEDTTPATDPAADPAPAPDVERGTRLRESLQPLVDDGTITAEQADAVVTQLKDSMPEREGRGGHFGRGGRGGFPFDGEVLETLGIDVATLREQLQAGSSLADIAAAQGVDVQALIDTLVTEGSERIDEAVAAGRIDEAEAATRKADLETRVTEMVNKTFDGSFGEGGPGRRGPGERPDADATTDDTATTDTPTTDAPADTGPTGTAPVTTED